MKHIQLLALSLLCISPCTFGMQKVLRFTVKTISRHYSEFSQKTIENALRKDIPYKKVDRHNLFENTFVYDTPIKELFYTETLFSNHSQLIDLIDNYDEAEIQYKKAVVDYLIENQLITADSPTIRFNLESKPSQLLLSSTTFLTLFTLFAIAMEDAPGAAFATAWVATTFLCAFNIVPPDCKQAIFECTPSDYAHMTNNSAFINALLENEEE